MTSMQRTSRVWLSDAAKKHELYVTFGQDQLIANQMLRASQVAYHFANQAVRDEPPNQSLASLLQGQVALRDVSMRYGAPREATVSVFRRDLGVIDRRLQDAVIVYYIGAFERFLNNFCREAATTLTARGEDRHLLAKLLKEATGDGGDRWSIKLASAADRFPEIKARLTESFPTHQPLEYVPPKWNCFSVTEMWREVRNLIVHHDRKVHQTFINAVGAQWKGYRSTFKKRASKPAVGSNLPLEYQDVIHCFTHVRRSVDELIAILCDEYNAIPEKS